MGKNLLLWLIIAAVLLTVFNNFNVEPKPESMAYSDFVKAVNDRKIREVQIQGENITAIDTTGSKWAITRLETDQKLIDDLINNGVKTEVMPEEKQASGCSCW